jgi:uncharacterized membrane protein YbhN (UPF0104 family)
VWAHVVSGFPSTLPFFRYVSFFIIKIIKIIIVIIIVFLFLFSLFFSFFFLCTFVFVSFFFFLFFISFFYFFFFLLFRLLRLVLCVSASETEAEYLHKITHVMLNGKKIEGIDNLQGCHSMKTLYVCASEGRKEDDRKDRKDRQPTGVIIPWKAL